MWLEKNAKFIEKCELRVYKRLLPKSFIHAIPGKSETRFWCFCRLVAGSPPGGSVRTFDPTSGEVPASQQAAFFKPEPPSPPSQPHQVNEVYLFPIHPKGSWKVNSAGWTATDF